jgi:hypothetical protein
MNMTKRLNKLEERLKTNSKFKDCELEIVAGTDNEPTTYFCRYPDGHRELLTDRNVINELEAIPGDEISVEIVD